MTQSETLPGRQPDEPTDYVVYTGTAYHGAEWRMGQVVEVKGDSTLYVIDPTWSLTRRTRVFRSNLVAVSLTRAQAEWIVNRHQAMRKAWFEQQTKIRQAFDRDVDHFEQVHLAGYRPAGKTSGESYKSEPY